MYVVSVNPTVLQSQLHRYVINLQLLILGALNSLDYFDL